MRDLPDVSLFAANGVWGHYYIFCWSDTEKGGADCADDPGGWSAAGGTSFASPIMAGIQALINQKTGQNQGNPNSVYYQLAATEYNGSSADCDSQTALGWRVLVFSMTSRKEISMSTAQAGITVTSIWHEGVLSTQTIRTPCIPRH